METDNHKLILGTSLGATQNVPKYYVFHCSDVSYTLNKNQFKSINDYHRDVRGFPKSSLGFYVGYHDLFTGGVYYKCKEEWEVGAHCNQGYDGVKVYPPGTEGKLSMNYQSLGGCIAFDGDIEQSPLIEQGLLQKRAWEIQEKYPGIIFKLHRDFAAPAKTCPGTLITQRWLDELVKKPIPTIISPKPIESMCATQDKIIQNQKAQITFFEKWYQWFVERYS